MEIWQGFRILFPWVRAILCYLLILMLTIRMLPLLRLTGRFIQLVLFRCSRVTFLFGRWNGGMCVYICISFFFRKFKYFLFISNACKKSRTKLLLTNFIEDRTDQWYDNYDMLLPYKLRMIFFFARFSPVILNWMKKLKNVIPPTTPQ